MSITDNLKRAQAQLARVMPHADTFTVMVDGPPGEDAYGYPIPGTPTQSGPLVCHADRLSAEDATRAGLASSSEVWQVVTNLTDPAVTPDSTLTLTLADGRTVPLAVRKVAGRNRQVITAERA